MAGQSFDLTNDKKILSINSPQVFVGGPYAVVYKNIAERWVIVAMNWDKKPGLAIRWFWGNGGNPFSSAHPTWLVLPSELTVSILNGLPLNFNFRKNLDLYLSGQLPGTGL